jgi:hypothetical protein
MAKENIFFRKITRAGFINFIIRAQKIIADKLEKKADYITEAGIYTKNGVFMYDDLSKYHQNTKNSPSNLPTCPGEFPFHGDIRVGFVDDYLYTNILLVQCAGKVVLEELLSRKKNRQRVGHEWHREAYLFLHQALLNPNPRYCLRGPEEFIHSDFPGWKYRNYHEDGDIFGFLRGQECLFYEKKLRYRMFYQSVLLDQSRFRD